MPGTSTTFPEKGYFLHAKSLSHVSLCDPIGLCLPGSSVCGILQARILEWVAISSSRGSSQLGDQTHVSYVSCIGRWVLLPLAPPGKPMLFIVSITVNPSLV